MTHGKSQYLQKTNSQRSNIDQHMRMEHAQKEVGEAIKYFGKEIPVQAKSWCQIRKLARKKSIDELLLLFVDRSGEMCSKTYTKEKSIASINELPIPM